MELDEKIRKKHDKFRTKITKTYKPFENTKEIPKGFWKLIKNIIFAKNFEHLFL